MSLFPRLRATWCSLLESPLGSLLCREAPLSCALRSFWMNSNLGSLCCFLANKWSGQDCHSGWFGAGIPGLQEGQKWLWRRCRLALSRRQQIMNNTIPSICKCHVSSSCDCQSYSCLRTPFHKYHILCWGFGLNVALVGAASDWRCGTSANTLGTVPFLQNNLGTMVWASMKYKHWAKTKQPTKSI